MKQRRPPTAPSAGRRASPGWECIYAVVRRIPTGRVATYGQVARLAGLPGHARQVGYALHAAGDEELPWHRVINARGEISERSDPADAHLQRHLLIEEGILPDAAGRFSLRRYRWNPEAPPPARRRPGGGRRRP